MLILFRELVGTAAHVAYDAQSESLSLLAFAMVCTDKRHQTFGESDKSYTESTLIDDTFYGLAGCHLITAVPQTRHEQGELLGKSGLLEIEPVAKLTVSDVEHIVELLHETADAFFFILDHHAFDGDADYIDCGEAEIATSDGCLLAIAVFEHTGAASHGGYFISVTFGIISVPFLVLVISGVEIDKVGEEPPCRDFTCKFVKVVVAIAGQIAYSTLFLPYLYGGRWRWLHCLRPRKWM